MSNRESGIGNRESGIGSRESGIGNRESGIGSVGSVGRWGEPSRRDWIPKTVLLPTPYSLLPTTNPTGKSLY
ncbi:MULTISPECIES: hypothetical protein [unclassified Moorena]|uniref:hypothetical protein n=1 Tax=unclassified Moorena TaxID=2683338 RepID=UPI0013B8D48A|nr:MULTISPECIES: hypothetical protein [unclassified Moorena]NEP31263.1 hypothetical protein [Moorena sp. SIO3B2]NEQ09553.1 hypothetical protein [Moorena sp. SIO4E2]